MCSHTERKYNGTKRCHTIETSINTTSCKLRPVICITLNEFKLLIPKDYLAEQVYDALFFKNYSLTELIYLQVRLNETKPILGNTKNHKNSLSKQNKHTLTHKHTLQAKVTSERVCKDKISNNPLEQCLPFYSENSEFPLFGENLENPKPHLQWEETPTM